MSYGVGLRRGLDPVLLWLWHRLVATAPTGPLAWEPPYAAGAAQEMAKRQKKKMSNCSTSGHYGGTGSIPGPDLPDAMGAAPK